MNSTTDPNLRSFLAISPESHFPIQNLPYGVFRRSSADAPRIGVAIGDHVLDVCALEELGLLRDAALAGKGYFQQPTLNAFMAAGRPAWRAARAEISRLLSADEPTLRDNAAARAQTLVEQNRVTMLLPAVIGDYTDFYSSREHATNMGIMLRGQENALLPNWLHLPVAYHGRSSSIVVSGTDLRRPMGQTKADTATAPSFGPSRAVDFELEMGFFIGPGNALGRPIPIDQASEHIFGMVLVNDWSARDIQKWEYQPLGPFLAKNFGTSISPWVVTLDALEPFRIAGPPQDPPPLPYLQSAGNWAYNIQLEIQLQTSSMKQPERIAASNSKFLYWNIWQQLAHHAANGCNLRPGDLMASGTISGPAPDSYGSMLELTWRGEKPITLPNSERRTFLHDGDCVTMTGWCQGQGCKIGFGTVTGVILPSA